VSMYTAKPFSVGWDGVSHGAYIIDVETFQNKVKATAATKKIVRYQDGMEEEDMEIQSVRRAMMFISYTRND